MARLKRYELYEGDGEEIREEYVPLQEREKKQGLSALQSAISADFSCNKRADLIHQRVNSSAELALQGIAVHGGENVQVNLLNVSGVEIPFQVAEQKL